MPDPSGIRAERLGEAKEQLGKARGRLMAAARATDEAHAPHLHQRIMALVANLDEVGDEVNARR